jgi:hypothetical protein
MATQVLQAGGMSAVRSRPRPRSRAAWEPSLLGAICRMAVVVLLVLGLCGMVAFASSSVAGTTPPEGPAPGLDL